MTRTRVLASLAVAAALSGVPGTLPMANATPLDDQNGVITGDRAKYGGTCPPLKFNPTLESMAQDAIQRVPAVNGFGVANEAPNASRYNGAIRHFSGYGDPQAAALTDAYEDGAGPLLSNCEYTEFGSGFWRDEDRGTDHVMIIFGKPAPAVPVPPAAPAAPEPPPPEPITKPPPPGRPDDRDSDGLLDDDETKIYRTNPDVGDTDGDGPDDGQEVYDGTDPRNPNDP